MFREHRLVHTPPDSARIWRYLDFTKFIALLESRALHFTRGDGFEDRFEAAVPARDLAAARDYFNRQLTSPEIDIEGVSRFRREDVRPYIKSLLNLTDAEVAAIDDEDLPRHMLRITSRFLYLNCWNMSEGESAGMWDLYGKLNDGIAVVSTVGALKHAFLERPEDEPVYIGEVRYLDYDHDSWGEFTPLSQAFHKRSSFQHEREVRAVVVNPSHVDARRSAALSLPVDLGRLVESFRVSHRAPPWVGELAGAVARRYGLTAPVVPSALNADPEF